MTTKPSWVFKDDTGGSDFNKWTLGDLSGRVNVRNVMGRTAGGMLGPLPAYEFCVDVIIVEASSSVTSASIVSFDADIASSAPSRPTQISLSGDFLEEGGMRFCADSCDGKTRKDSETDFSVDCWTKKNDGTTVCPEGVDDRRAAAASAAAAAAAAASGGATPSGGNATDAGGGDGGGGGAAVVVVLLLICCCCCAAGAALWWWQDQDKKKGGTGGMASIQKKMQETKSKISKKKSGKKKSAGGGGVELSAMPEGWIETVSKIFFNRLFPIVLIPFERIFDTLCFYFQYCLLLD